MAIKSIQVGQAGVSNNTPSWVYIETNDTYAAVTAAGYLSGAAKEYVNSFQNNMMALVSTKTSQAIGVQPVLYLLQLQSAANGVWSLVAPAVDVPVPFIVPGNVEAGLSGVAGAFLSYPATASKGYLELAAVANTGNTATIISNVAMGQASTISIPDPANAAARFLVAATATPFTSGNLPRATGTGGVMVDSGVAYTNLQLTSQVKAGTTADIGGAGAGPITITVTGLTAASVVVATVASSSNVVAVAKAIAGTGGFNVTFSDDPGAACVLNYVAYIVAQ